ncbi:MAG: aldehyde dehydrogenase family protein [Lentisphaeria bacterium]|nr:aldehyde dehydrogenase family protein [Lentisphaeria bacterium]
MNEISPFLEKEQLFFQSGSRMSVAERKNALIKLIALLKENREKLFSALYDDLHKSENEAAVSEYIPLITSIRYLIKNLRRFAAPEYAGASIANFGGRGKIIKEPYGNVLVVSTWNYPLLLSIEPLAAALAAGNSVTLKLSPLSPATTRMLIYIINQCFKNEHVTVAENDSLEELLHEKWDYIFFTGGIRMGRIVAECAAKKLTPVTLELGGKNPCIVDASADLQLAATRIVWGKFMNAGQTCAAPDYLLVEKSIQQKFMNILRKEIQNFFGESPEESPDYSRIINQDHYNRLAALIGQGKLVTGGERNPDSLYIAPTVIEDIHWTDPIMENEIFGPILPVITMDSLDDVLPLIGRRPKSLSAYYFGKNRKNMKKFMNSISFGGGCINDCIMHLCSPHLPFGGVGSSGMGAYHGKASFDTFTHRKSILVQTTMLNLTLRFPPFGALKKFIIKLVTKAI